MAAGFVWGSDELLTIDGLPYTANARATFERAHAAGRPVTVGIERLAAGTVESITIWPTPITFGDVVDVKLPELLVAVTFWLLLSILNS